MKLARRVVRLGRGSSATGIQPFLDSHSERGNRATIRPLPFRARALRRLRAGIDLPYECPRHLRTCKFELFPPLKDRWPDAREEIRKASREFRMCRALPNRHDARVSNSCPARPAQRAADLRGNRSNPASSLMTHRFAVSSSGRANFERASSCCSRRGVAHRLSSATRARRRILDFVGCASPTGVLRLAFVANREARGSHLGPLGSDLRPLARQNPTKRQNAGGSGIAA